jgi:hypothetical protein
VGNSCFQVISPEYGLIELELSFPTPNVSASICLLSKLEIQARENLERWQASSIVIDSEITSRCWPLGKLSFAGTWINSRLFFEVLFQPTKRTESPLTACFTGLAKSLILRSSLRHSAKTLENRNAFARAAHIYIKDGRKVDPN